MLNVCYIANCTFGMLHKEQIHIRVLLFVLTPFVYEVHLGGCSDLSYRLNETWGLFKSFQTKII